MEAIDPGSTGLITLTPRSNSTENMADDPPAPTFDANNIKEEPVSPRTPTRSPPAHSERSLPFSSPLNPRNATLANPFEAPASPTSSPPMTLESVLEKSELDMSNKYREHMMTLVDVLSQTQSTFNWQAAPTPRRTIVKQIADTISLAAAHNREPRAAAKQASQQITKTIRDPFGDVDDLESLSSSPAIAGKRVRFAEGFVGTSAYHENDGAPKKRRAKTTATPGPREKDINIPSTIAPRALHKPAESLNAKDQEALADLGHFIDRVKAEVETGRLAGDYVFRAVVVKAEADLAKLRS